MDLIDRYLAAVRRHLPRKRQDDVFHFSFDATMSSIKGCLGTGARRRVEPRHLCHRRRAQDAQYHSSHAITK